MNSIVMAALLLQVSSFETAANAFTGCLTATVQMGMRTKMDPEMFEIGFAKSCKVEEARFRAEAIKVAVAMGRSEEEAVKEVEGNIAKGRRIFAADQASYVRTGKVPR